MDYFKSNEPDYYRLTLTDNNGFQLILTDLINRYPKSSKIRISNTRICKAGLLSLRGIDKDDLKELYNEFKSLLKTGKKTDSDKDKPARIKTAKYVNLPGRYGRLARYYSLQFALEYNLEINANGLMHIGLLYLSKASETEYMLLLEASKSTDENFTPII